MHMYDELNTRKVLNKLYYIWKPRLCCLSGADASHNFELDVIHGWCWYQCRRYISIKHLVHRNNVKQITNYSDGNEMVLPTFKRGGGGSIVPSTQQKYYCHGVWTLQLGVHYCKCRWNLNSVQQFTVFFVFSRQFWPSLCMISITFFFLMVICSVC